MNTYISNECLTDGFLRTYPIIDSAAESYYDFKANPELIPQALETFTDWSDWEGIQLFYKLVEWLNGPESRLESNGCGFRGPHENPQKDVWPKELITTGGLLFLFRDLELNLSEESAAGAMRPLPVGVTAPPSAPSKNISWLCRRSYEYLQQLNPDFIWGCVEVTLCPTLYTAPPLGYKDRFGHEVAFRWYVWGDTKKEAMAHFKQLVATMFECLKRVSAEAK